MSGLLGGLMGGKGKAQQVDWKQLERMMDYSARLNRFNDVGIFGGTEWTENPDGTWKREHVVNEALQPGIENIMNRAAGPLETQTYQSPWQAQMDQLMNAKMANQLGRSRVPDFQQPQEPIRPPQPQQQPMQAAPHNMPQPSEQMVQALAQQQQAPPQQAPQQQMTWDRMARR